MDPEDEVEDDVEDVREDDAFGDAHASDSDEDFAPAAIEESDDDEPADVLSPSKIALAKAEKARLRQLKKQQREEIEKVRLQQNAAIAKVRKAAGIAAHTRPPRIPATSSSGKTHAVSGWPISSQAPKAQIAPMANCPSAPMFQTLARYATERPRAIRLKYNAGFSALPHCLIGVAACQG